MLLKWLQKMNPCRWIWQRKDFGQRFQKLILWKLVDWPWEYTKFLPSFLGGLSNPYYFRANTLPETNSSHLKIGHPKRKGSSSNHPFSGAMLVFGGVNPLKKVNPINTHYIRCIWGWSLRGPHPKGTIFPMTHFLSEQWKKPWLFTAYRGLYYPILWGL